MKTIIISDINGHYESIIPYGLRIGRLTETPVEIVHIIDSRKHHGVSSPYADSGSIAPGGKMSHEKILQREKNKASSAIEKMMSAEASRLNYPLKISINVNIDGVKRGIGSVVKTDPQALLIASTQPGNSMLGDLNELLSITLKLDPPSLMVPPKHSFSPAEKVVLFTDFRETAYARIREIIKWLSFSRATINAIGMASGKELLEMDLRSSAWKKVIEEYAGPFVNLNTTIIDKKNHANPLLQYVNKNDPDMVILPGMLLKSGFNKVIRAEKADKTIQSFHKPVLIY